jgi:hypothetical protein
LTSHHTYHSRSLPEQVNQYRPKYSIRVFQQNRLKADIVKFCVTISIYLALEWVLAVVSSVK